MVGSIGIGKFSWRGGFVLTRIDRRDGGFVARRVDRGHLVVVARERREVRRPGSTPSARSERVELRERADGASNDRRCSRADRTSGAGVQVSRDARAEPDAGEVDRRGGRAEIDALDVNARPNDVETRSSSWASSARAVARTRRRAFSLAGREDCPTTRCCRSRWQRPSTLRSLRGHVSAPAGAEVLAASRGR